MLRELIATQIENAPDVVKMVCVRTFRQSSKSCLIVLGYYSL